MSERTDSEWVWVGGRGSSGSLFIPRRGNLRSFAPHHPGQWCGGSCNFNRANNLSEFFSIFCSGVALLNGMVDGVEGQLFTICEDNIRIIFVTESLFN